MAVQARLGAIVSLLLLLVVVFCATLPTQSTAISIISAADEDDNTAALDDDGMADDDDDDIDADDDNDEDDTADSAEEKKEEDKPCVIDPPGEENASGYELPDTSSALFFDGFQDGLKKWFHTSADGYNGKFVIGQGVEPTFPGDRALIIPEKARKYGISAPISGLSDTSGKDFVLQYEVKIDEAMTCGGAYVKLPTEGYSPKSFDGSTTYSVMFGPDRCGATDKTHFIFQSKNPKTGEFIEHHLKDPPSVANAFDKKTHLYAVWVKSDGSFELHIDGENRKKGTLMDSFEPPLQPVEEIDDPEDKKPEDWVDEEKIPDPNAVKPDDWDEEAPAEIEDMDAEKPEGWLDDEPKKIPDPETKKPEEWDDDEDGEWESPMVNNPKCDEVGCGEWTRPMKANPAFKGKWTAPMIDNPKYIGEWKPKKIPNEKYYKVENPSILPVHGIGFEIWTMDQGVLFDNIWIGTDFKAAEAFREDVFRSKQKTEVARDEERSKASEAEAKTARPGSLGKVMDKVEDAINALEDQLQPLEQLIAKNGGEVYLEKLMDWGVNKPMVITVTAPLAIVILFLLLLGGKKAKPSEAEQATAVAAEKKKNDEPTPDDTVDDVAESTATDMDQEKSVRRRRTATAE